MSTKPAWWPAGLVWTDDEPWEVVLEPTGRWQWWIRLRRGAMTEFGRPVYGSQAHAEATARRRLHRQRRRDVRTAKTVVLQ